MTKKIDISGLVAELKAKKGAKVLLKGNQTSPLKSLSYHDSRKSYTPDIEVVYENKRDYYAVEKKITAAELPNLISKWILFALEARLKRGNFFLVVEGEQNARKCQAIIDRKQLAVQLITIK